MPNILQSQPEETPTQNVTSGEIPQELMDTGLNLKTMEFLNYLEMKDEMFNGEVVDKVKFLTNFIPEVKDLWRIDTKLGVTNGMTKLDKLYSYVKLLEQEARIKQESDLISNAKKQWQENAQPSQT